MKIELPDPCLVVLIGASSSGKSTFAHEHFPATSILSSDAFRGMLVDDENSLLVNDEAFDALHYIARTRLRLMRLTVVDATNVERDWRAPLVRIAKDNDLFAVAIVFATPQKLCLQRNEARPDRTIPEGAIRRHCRSARRASVKNLKREGFRHVYVVRPEDEVEIVRNTLYADRRHERGPFDIIGDVHGCMSELTTLVQRLGYAVEDGRVVSTPPGRRLFFVGDLCDRGPDSPGVLSFVMNAVDDGFALCVPGNHDAKLLRVLKGNKVKLSHGLDLTMEQLERCDDAFRDRARTFLDSLISHLIVDGGKLVVAHAGMKESYQGRSSGRVRAFALYGDTSGEFDELGLPVRRDWGAEYRGDAAVVYGHTPVWRPQWVNNTINIDTGCVFGGQLTALRWPERDLVSVPAEQTYAEPARPLAPPAATDLLPPDVDELIGRLRVQTRHAGLVTVRPEFSSAALEVMSRFAVNPRWMPYLPPTMSPVATSEVAGFLERPEEAFAYYEEGGATEVVCQEKHMGSRAVVVLARTPEVAESRFAETGRRMGVVYTRTGRPFFGSDEQREAAVVDRLSTALESAGIWEEFDADWACLDTEIMPWSLKARDLLVSQYASTGTAARAASAALVDVVQQAQARGVVADDFALRAHRARDAATAFTDAYRRYCWDVASVDEIRVAPFHIMALGDVAGWERPHRWHLDLIDRMCDAEPIVWPTQRRWVTLQDAGAREAAVQWWEELTTAGGEGMVVKPAHFVTPGEKGPLQPGVKVRGREYLRIIYGPTYTEDDNLERLRKRGLGRKRSLARREFALGLEALERFIRQETMRRVHEAVFAVLALESEPVDPRL